MDCPKVYKSYKFKKNACFSYPISLDRGRQNTQNGVKRRIAQFLLQLALLKQVHHKSNSFVLQTFHNAPKYSRVFQQKTPILVTLAYETPSSRWIQLGRQFPLYSELWKTCPKQCGGYEFWSRRIEVARVWTLLVYRVLLNNSMF